MDERNRGRFDRSQQRYPSDLTAEEWRLVAADTSGEARWRDRRIDMREVESGLMYILSTRCQWRATPNDLLPSRPNETPPKPPA